MHKYPTIADTAVPARIGPIENPDSCPVARSSDE